MNEIDKANLIDQTKFQLNEITNIENCFDSEINRRKSCSKTLSKYVAAFDYIDKISIAFSATSGVLFLLQVLIQSYNWDSKSEFYFNFFLNHSKRIAKNY